MDKSLKDSQKELQQSKHRIATLDTIIQNLYEDKISGSLTEERFVKLSQSYEQEQNHLTNRVIELEKHLSEVHKQTLNTESFLKQVRECTDVSKLTPEIIRLFVDKIVVEKSEKIKGKRTKKQTIWIHWNYIGILDIK